jgi:hypothetical protein
MSTGSPALRMLSPVVIVVNGRFTRINSDQCRPLLVHEFHMIHGPDELSGVVL